MNVVFRMNNIQKAVFGAVNNSLGDNWWALERDAKLAVMHAAWPVTGEAVYAGLFAVTERGQP